MSLTFKAMGEVIKNRATMGECRMLENCLRQRRRNLHGLGMEAVQQFVRAEPELIDYQDVLGNMRPHAWDPIFYSTINNVECRIMFGVGSTSITLNSSNEITIDIRKREIELERLLRTFNLKSIYDHA